MSVIDFPANPTLNQEYTHDDMTWIWTSVYWARKDTIVRGAPGPRGKYVASLAPPAFPEDGDGWYDIATGKTYIYYDSYWVEAGAGTIVGQGATVTVGVVSTLPSGTQPTVTARGTSSDVILDFGIPAGEPGTGIYYGTFYG